jgi:O-antigen/teichoic acid export membrane protein
MSMFEDEHNVGDVTSDQTLEDNGAVYESSLNFTMPDGLPIDQHDTWIIPVVRSPKAFIAGAVGHVSLLRDLMKKAGIYALASVASPLISLALAPFLTHHLSPSDYGILSVLNTFILLGAAISQLGLPSAFFRAYNYDYTSSRDQRDVLATVATLLCLVSIPAATGMALLAPFLANFFFGRPSLGGLVALASGVMLLQNLAVPGSAWLRAESRALFFALLATGNVLIVLITNIILVGILHLGAAGSLIATGCGYGSSVLCTMPMILLRVGIKIRTDMVWGLLTFGLPAVLNIVTYWVLQLSDRYLLTLLGSPVQTARYSVAYSLGSAMSVVVMGPFGLAWQGAMYAIAKRKDAAEVFQLVFRWFSMFLLFAAFGLSLVGIILLDWLFPLTYHSGALVIPIVALSLAFYGVYYVCLTGAYITRKAWLAAVFTTIAAILNVALNLVLIPLYGPMGAAASTLLAYVVLAIIAYIVNQRIYPVPFEIGKFIFAVLVGAALYIGSDFLGRGLGTYKAWAVSSGALVFYGGFLVLLGLSSSRSSLMSGLKEVRILIDKYWRTR